METEITVGVAKESFPGETRVALTPIQVPVLAKTGFRVVLEAGAGAAAGYDDDGYAERGAEVVDRAGAFGADVLVQVRSAGANPAGRDDLNLLHRGSTVIGVADALADPRGVKVLADRGVRLFALDLVPRIARAQSMDALSSQATVAGYRAAVMAADRLPKLFPMLTTAAGTVAPARVFVIGAGVAGLQAIATSRRLGAVVEAYDVRPAAQDDVESLGARLIPLPLAPGDAEDAAGYAKELGEAFYRRQQEHLRNVVAGVDVAICTAAIPGKRAPVLLTDEALQAMSSGSVVVDLAASSGGNCSRTVADETIWYDGVQVLGPTNLPATAPFHASQLYARNVTSFLQLLVHDGALAPDHDDEIVRGTLVAEDGAVVQERVRTALEEVAA